MLGLEIFIGAWMLLVTIGAFSGQNTWTHYLAVGVDILTFSIIKRKYDVTISSWCGLQIRAGSSGSRFGRALGWCLNHIQTNHCELAIQADTQRAQNALIYLGLNQTVAPLPAA